MAKLSADAQVKKAAKQKAIADLKTAIKTAATDAALADPVFGGVDGKAYEVWVVMALAARFKGAGFAVTACDNTGKPAADAVWRVGDGPRYLTDLVSQPNKAGSLRVSTPTTIEIHNSLIHKGLSAAEHELDVSIVDARQAESIRAGGGGAFDGKPEQGFELKDYAAGTPLNKNIARALLCVGFELDALEPQTAGTVRSDPGRLVLGTRTKLTPPTHEMLNYYDADGAENLTPGNPGLLDKVVAKLI